MKVRKKRSIEKKWNTMNMKSKFLDEFDFLKGYNIFLCEHDTYIEFVGTKSNLLFYFSTSCQKIGKEDADTMKRINEDCGDNRWYKLKCPVYFNDTGKYFRVRECVVEQELSKAQTKNVMEYLRIKEVRI